MRYVKRRCCHSRCRPHSAHTFQLMIEAIACMHESAELIELTNLGLSWFVPLLLALMLCHCGRVDSLQQVTNRTTLWLLSVNDDTDTFLSPQIADVENLSAASGFSCEGKVIGGYYAEIESGCQMFHVCTRGQKGIMQYITDDY